MPPAGGPLHRPSPSRGRRRPGRKPTAEPARHVRQAHAQEQAYVSQGRAVEHAARQQRHAAHVRRVAAKATKDTKGASDLARANAYKRRPRYTRDVQAARVAGFKASPAYKNAKGSFGYFSSLLHIANSPAAKLRQADREVD